MALYCIQIVKGIDVILLAGVNDSHQTVTQTLSPIMIQWSPGNMQKYCQYLPIDGHLLHGLAKPIIAFCDRATFLL